MADDSDDGSSATEEEDEPLALEDHISQWVLDENQAGYMEMSQSLLKHQANSRFQCQQAEGNECCDAQVGCQKADGLSRSHQKTGIGLAPRLVTPAPCLRMQTFFESLKLGQLDAAN